MGGLTGSSGFGVKEALDIRALRFRMTWMGIGGFFGSCATSDCLVAYSVDEIDGSKESRRLPKSTNPNMLRSTGPSSSSGSKSMYSTGCNSIGSGLELESAPRHLGKVEPFRLHDQFLFIL